MVRVIRNKTIFKATATAIFAAIFCIGCGDKDGDTNLYCDGAAIIITFDATGGTVTPASGIAETRYTGSCDYGRLMTTPVPSREGYTFHGWFTAETGGVAVEAGRNSALFSRDTTIYAHWTPNRYRITFDAHGGDVTPAYDTTGEGWTLANLPTPTRDDHTFDGWYTDIVGIGDTVTTSHAFRENTTIYAHWIYTGVHYTITFDATGGTVDPPTEETDVGGKLEDLPLPERDSYAFRGWFTAETGGDTVTTNTAFNQATTVYARWTLITDKMYLVTFDAHGGTVTPKSGVTGEDGKLLAALPVPVREGYTFLGWFSEDGAVTASTVFTANTGVHAQWKIIHYIITYDATGGTVSPASDTTGAHWEIADLPAPTRGGYDFAGWFTEEAGGGEVTGSTALIGNLTIYAHWTSNDTRYTVTFDAAGGGAVASQSVVRNGTITAPDAFARAGYTFGGWYREDARTHVWNLDTDVVTADITLYAKWVKIPTGGDTFIDSRDNKTYKKVVIGNQTWMAENLNYDVPDAASDVCYDNSDGNCTRYGRLYDWSSAMGGGSSSTANPSGVQGVCPVGWHLPSVAEWTELFEFVGYATAATKLKSAADWRIYRGSPAGADEYGFSALPGGWGGSNGNFNNAGDYGFWWSATERITPYESEKDRAWTEEMAYDFEFVQRAFGTEKRMQISVRCVED